MNSMDNYLSIVTTDWNGGDIRIDPNSNLIQYKEDDTGKIITVDMSSDPQNRPVRGSDLSWFLKTRYYNRMDTKGIDSDGDLAFISDYEDLGGTIVASEFEKIPNNDVTTMMSEVRKINSIYSDLLSIQLDDIPFDNGSEVHDVMDPNYYNFGMIRSISQSSTMINVLTMGNKIYTDTINLNTVGATQNALEDYKCKIVVKVGIQFSDTNSLVHNKDLVFNFKGDFHQTIDGLIELEYSNRCIRLFQLSDEVVEGIFTYCYISYE